MYRFVSAVDDDASGIFYIRGVDPFQCAEPTGPADVVEPPLKKPAHEPVVIDLLPGCSESQPLELEESQELSSPPYSPSEEEEDTAPGGWRHSRDLNTSEGSNSGKAMPICLLIPDRPTGYRSSQSHRDLCVAQNSDYLDYSYVF